MYKTPKKLKKINIMGQSVRIVIDQALCNAAGAMGLYTHGIIVLLPEYASKAEYVDTLSHECFHALNGVLGTQLDPNLEEILANTMGQMNVQLINALLKNNVLHDEVPEEAE